MSWRLVFWNVWVFVIHNYIWFNYSFPQPATVDVKRNIYDLSINKYGSQIAIVENQGGYDSVQESAVRIYSVGRKKNAEDEAVRILLFGFQYWRIRETILYAYNFDSQEEDDDDAISDEASISDASDSAG